MYEHQNSLAVLKSDAELGLKQAEEQAAGREQQLLADQRALQQQVREQARRLHPFGIHRTLLECKSLKRKNQPTATRAACELQDHRSGEGSGPC